MKHAKHSPVGLQREAKIRDGGCVESHANEQLSKVPFSSIITHCIHRPQIRYDNEDWQGDCLSRLHAYKSSIYKLRR